MPTLSDAVVIGTVLTLVFTAVAYYLYSRITQVESKVGLLESILLNLKMATEATLLAGSREEPPMPMQAPRIAMTEMLGSSIDEIEVSQQARPQEDQDAAVYQSILDQAHQATPPTEMKEVHVVQPRPQSVSISSGSSGSAPALHVTKDEDGNSRVHIGFESMSWKELCAEGKKRGITGMSHMNRKKLIAILNEKEGIKPTTPEMEQTSVQDAWGKAGDQESLDLPSAQDFPDGGNLATL